MEMTPDEIVVNYRQAKHKGQQLRILADMNCCTVDDIVRILCEKGGYQLERMSRSRGKAKELAAEPVEHKKAKKAKNERSIDQIFTQLSGLFKELNAELAELDRQKNEVERQREAIFERLRKLYEEVK